MRSRCSHCVRSLFFKLFVTFLFLLVLTASCLAQETGPVAPVLSRLTQPIDGKQLVTLQGTVHPLANAANDRGAAEDGMPLDRIQVVLKRSASQEAALKQAIADMHTPGSATYHKWLTPQQFGQQYGPSDADIETLKNWLAAQGFNVTKVNAGKQTLEMSGTAGQFRNAFHAQIRKYAVNGQTHYANATDPQIPAALAPVLGGFASLNNFQLKSNIKVLGKAQLDAKTHKTTPAWTEGLNGVNLVLAPGDFAVQYNLNPLYSAGTTGTGQTIAIINESNIDIALVNQYRSLFGLPVNPPAVIIDGNDPGIDGVNNPDGPNGASVEAYLDVEQSGAVAPAANIDLVIAGDTALQNGLGLAAEHAVYGDVAPVLSISFGGCEAGQGTFWDGLWEQAAAQGQTVMVSTGDNGSAGCDDDDTQQYAVDGQAVNGIASTPYDVAVGGTDFYYSSYNGTSTAQDNQLATYWNLTPSNQTPTVSLLQVIPEQPWNDSQYGLNLFNQYAYGDGTTIAAGSGGASNCATGSPTQTSGGSGGTCAGYPKPAWQTALTPADAVRDLPDVSLYASNGANYSFYPICAEDGDCQAAPAGGEVQITGVGGTSASAPAFAGIMALVNQRYGPQGQADFVLYPLAQQFPTAFNDVANGTNSVPCAVTAVQYEGVSYPPVDCIPVSNPVSVDDTTFGVATEGQIGTGTTPEYNAVTGYDLASGLGTINANVLVTNWGNVKFTTSSVTLTPSQTGFTHGTAITISGAVTPGTSTGNVALMTTSTEPLNVVETTFPVTAGQYSGSVSYLPGGTYNIYGIYSGDGTNASSTSSQTSITVTPEASATTFVALNTTGAIASGATLPYGSQLLLEALPGSVNPANTTSVPTGSVTFLSGTTTIGTAQINAQGQAELNYALPPSSTTYSLTAKYSGDNSYNASTSSPLTFTVGKDTPAIGLSSGTQTTSTVTGSPGTTTLTVQVENEANAANQNASGRAYVNPAVAPTGVVTVTGLPSGTLTFPALQSSLDPGTLFIEGVASLQLPAETAGTYTVTVNYPGDANYSATTKQFPVTLTASTGIATTTVVSASPATAPITTPEQVTVTVTGTTAGGFPSGTLTLLISGYEFSPPTQLPASGSGDSVTVTIPLNGDLFQGANAITVQYSGNATYAPSAGTATITNGGASTPGFTLNDTGPITIASPGDSGTSTITVTPVGGFTGAVALTCAVTPATGTSVPTCLVTPVGTASALTYTLTVNTTSTTASGNYSVTVTGTATGATTQTITVPVTVNAAPAIALTNSGAITIASTGSSGTSTITVTPVGGFTGTVALSCAVTPTATTDTPACAVSAPAAITGAGAVTATLTVTTTASSAAVALPKFPLLPMGGGLALASLLFFFVPVRRRRWTALVGVMIVMAFAGLAVGCGGGSSSGSGPSNSGTPNGTYTVTVTGTAAGVTSQTTAVTVTVN